MPSAHAPLAPSAAKMWMACPGQPTLAAQVPDDTNEYSEEGSAAHTLAQMCLVPHHQTGTLCYINPDKYIGQWVNDDPERNYKGRLVTKEMCDAVRMYLDYCMENTPAGSFIRVEERLRLTDEVWGTGDFIRFNPKSGELLIVDYKHGEGVYVHVYMNPQLLLYMLMACLLYKGVKKLRIVIVQPRCGTENFIREWEVDPVTLMEFEQDVFDAVAKTKEPEPELFPGDHCRFCKARAVCPALVQLARKRAREDFDSMKATLKPVELANRLSEVTALKAYATAVENHAYLKAMAGEKVPGHKLVQKEAGRSFIDEAEAADTLINLLGIPEEKVYTKELVTPAALEKIIGKKKVKELDLLIHRKSSGVALARADDKRPEYHPATAKQDFAEADDILS